MQNPHQVELVAKVRQEAQPLKRQCLHLETLRGEINVWKDQFLRMGAEHTRILNQLFFVGTLAQLNAPREASLPDLVQLWPTLSHSEASPNPDSRFIRHVILYKACVRIIINCMRRQASM